MSRNPALLEECRDLVRAIRRHTTLEALRAHPEWSLLGQRLARVLGMVRRFEPARPPTASTAASLSGVRAVHWNLEHGNRYPDIEASLRTHPALADADLHLFCEVDLGMARSGNRDVAGDLAHALGRHGVWTPLFLETTPGRDEDPLHARDVENQESLFGIAMLSRWPITGVRVVTLPSPESYQFDVERMYGRHVALVATIDRPDGPFVAVAAHLEVHRTRAHRSAQMHAILDALDGEPRPIVLGGDFNTHTFDRGRVWSVWDGARVLMLMPTGQLRRRLRRPDRGAAREPLFDALRATGFAWDPFVDHAPTLPLRLSRLQEVRWLPGFGLRPLKRMLRWIEGRGSLRLDWFAGRGWAGGSGFTVRALGGPGRASDHAPIVAEFHGDAQA